MEIHIRDTEAADPQPFLLWDTVWNSDDLGTWYADWVLAGPNEANNSMGLSSLHALDTAILLCLFTWRRAEEYDVLPSGADPMGWWGDDVDLQDSETKIGSRLWLLIRAPLNSNTELLAENYAYEALQPLIDQGAVAKFVCTATADQVAGILSLAVQAFSQDGQKIYDQKFADLWKQEFPV